MLTNEHLLKDRPHPLGGRQRIYRFKDGWGLSVVNSRMLHSYPFAWEAAVVEGVNDDGWFEGLSYESGLTEDVEVFESDEEANAFIKRAAEHFAALPSTESTEKQT